MKIKKIKGSTFCIDTGMTYIPFYKIDDERIIMLDSGWGKKDTKGIDEILEKNKFKVAGIICSHAHVDHIGNNTHFKKKYNCIIAMPAHEALICSSLTSLSNYYINQTLTEIEKYFSDMICKTDMMILDNQNKVCICGIDFNIIHTPGHSVAHVCIITPDNVAYLGDSLVGYQVMSEAKLPYSCIIKEDLKSKVKLYDLNCSKYIVAHKGIYTDITKLVTDNINFYENKTVQIYNLISHDMTIEDIVDAVIENFNIYVDSKFKYKAIERTLKSYIDYLNEVGSIQSDVCDGILRYSKARLTIDSI